MFSNEKQLNVIVLCTDNMKQLWGSGLNMRNGSGKFVTTTEE